MQIQHYPLQVSQLGTMSGWKPLPLIIMGGMSLVAGLLALINLPETLGERLPETMDEALKLGKKGSNNKEENVPLSI